jgi:ectoine hydroxylase-related dioxygenase (phytanoyl-CoA dioxygenase family)|tara:strand:+ start:1865 stop:2692 length:828 start_codon:yes stop_codon:yes gene_type:complete
MTVLTSKQLKKYEDYGYIAPIDILSLEEVKEITTELEYIEKKWPNELIGLGRNNVHYISPVFDQIAHNSKILDVVQDIIGPNILVGGTTLFIKEPNNKNFVSWHQDAKYIGFEPHNWVTAWLAITDANEENGCMRMWPGTHKEKIKKHKDTFNKDNLLTRGQTVQSVPLKKTIPNVLKAGQLSLHHPRIVHGSGLNKSKSRRIGFVIQSYIGANVDQVIGKVYVQQARGKDLFKYHEHTSRPNELMNKDDVVLRIKANKELSKIFYKDARKKGKF